MGRGRRKIVDGMVGTDVDSREIEDGQIDAPDVSYHYGFRM